MTWTFVHGYLQSEKLIPKNTYAVIQHGGGQWCPLNTRLQKRVIHALLLKGDFIYLKMFWFLFMQPALVFKIYKLELGASLG